MDLDVKFRKRDWYPHSNSSAIHNTPIAKRAWCFQEKLLASRCLIFQKDEVVWECRSCCRCECGGEQEHFSVHESNVSEMRPYQQTLLPLADESLTAFAQLPFAEHEPCDGNPKHFANAEAAYSFWETAVKIFSERTLTVETDRLPAISAAASVVAEAIGDPTGADSYLAGLWRGDLLAGLAWVATMSPAGPHQGYIVPTWSWASRPGGGASYPDRTRHWRGADQAKLLNASTDLKKLGPSGGRYGPMSEVDDGAIVLFGVHCDVEMTISNHHGENEMQPKFGNEMQLNFENGEVETFCVTPHYLFGRLLDWMTVKLDTNNVDRLSENPRYLRRVGDAPGHMQCYGPHGQHGTQLQPACSGTVRLLWLTEDISLILTPSLEKEGAYYERLGIFHPGLVDDESEGTLTTNTPKMPKRVQRSEIKLV